MYMELHDTEVGNTRVATIRGIETLEQADEWVRKTVADERSKDVVRWELRRYFWEVVAVWERPKGSSEDPKRVEFEVVERERDTLRRELAEAESIACLAMEYGAAALEIAKEHADYTELGLTLVSEAGSKLLEETLPLLSGDLLERVQAHLRDTHPRYTKKSLEPAWSGR